MTTIANGPPRAPLQFRPDLLVSLPRLGSSCGAKTRAWGLGCRNPAARSPVPGKPRNGRCRLHGGTSTGPRTPEGRAAIVASHRRRARKFAETSEACMGSGLGVGGAA